MTRETVLFVESNTSGTGRLFIRAARELGLEPVLVTASPEKYSYLSEPDAPEVVTVPFGQENNVEKLIQECLDRRIVGVTSSSERFIATAANAASRLGLPGPDPVCTRAVRDKSYQRQILAAAGLPVPQFRVARDVPDAVAAAAEIEFPVVVKPVDGTGSMGVRTCFDAKDTERHVSSLLGENKESKNPVLIESLVDGEEFSLEVFSGQVVGITRKHLGAPPWFVETGHDYPATLPDHLRRKLIDTVTRGSELLGLGWGPLHWELRIHDGEPYVIEVNPRLAGGFIPELVRRAEGIDLIRETLRLVVGKHPVLEPRHHRYASIRFLLAPNSGRFIGAEMFEKASNKPWIVDVGLYPSAGEEVQVHGDFRDRVGHVIAVGNESWVAAMAADRGRDAVRVRIADVGKANPAAGYLPGLADGQHRLGTGRIREPLDWRAQKIVFKRSPERLGPEEFDFLVQIDKAHIVMLVEQKILSRQYARALLTAIDSIVNENYAPLTSRAAPRGWYLSYESWLIETLGENVGGAAHIGRSRNDMNATVFLLRLRSPYRRLVRELLRLVAVVIRRAERYADFTMPIYTHYQPAQPITYGHYLLGVALALTRDLQGISRAAEMHRCPLGACAVGGTTLPINTKRTARLLGFTKGVLHSVDAVASRDSALRLLAAATVLGATLSRLTTDLLLWSSQEFDLLRFPDKLVGSSSMLPQKRNPFLLEHIQGKAAAPLGAFTAATMAMHSTPFSNSVAVGTEAVKPLWGALDEITDGIELTRLTVAGAQPQAENMRRRTEEGFTAATELANQLVLGEGLSFRQAHRRVGELITTAAEHEESLEEVAAGLRSEHAPGVAVGLDPTLLAQRAEYGGGPGHDSTGRVVKQLRHDWARSACRLNKQSRRWRESTRKLNAAAAEMLDSTDV
jgi:argininosuccinate lyase